MGKRQFNEPCRRLVAALGIAVCLSSAYHLPVAQLDLQFLLLAFTTVVIGSRIGIQIPRIKAEITISDTFVFLTMLLYGGEAAVLLAASEAFCSSFRFNKRWLTRFFNAGLLACSTFLTVWVVRFCFGPINELAQGDASSKYIAAIFMMGSVQYVSNSGLAAVVESFKIDQSFWQTWRKYYLWTSITYFAGASAAGVITKLIGLLGVYAFIVIVPFITIVYFTYQTYHRNIEDAERHVEELNHHIEEQKRISQALQESEERFRSAFDHAAGMALVAPDGRWLKVNRSLCEILGYSEQELLASSFHDHVHLHDLGSLLTHIEELICGNTTVFQIEQRYVHKLGHPIWVLLSVSLVRDAQAEPSHLIFQIQDITDRKRAEERLVHDALHDTLTGLPNRALFMDHLKLAVKRATRHRDLQFAILFLDLDRFKIINDSLGHMVGDQLLVGIAHRLETCLRSADTIARLGGDEFTILLENIKDLGEVTQVAERIQNELSRPFNLGGHEVFTTASIGIALSAVGYDRAEDILRDADTAMYRAKILGKARHEVFNKDMHAHAINLLLMETDLRHALERQELSLHYQPVVSLKTNSLIGFEALVRWQHPQRGSVAPAEFIPIAEETGLIIPVGRWVLREACRQMRQWQKQFSSDPPLYISVNLSGKQFTQSDLITQIIQTLQETGLDPRILKLEITESVVMENIATAISMLQQLRAVGVEVSIDDFGTGYSSLSYLHRLPIDTLKIDRSFVSQMTQNDENTEIVRTIVTLAKSLELGVVAEGVETPEQLAQLRLLKCDGGQGYLFSVPLDAEAAEALIRKRARGKATFAPPEGIQRREGIDLLDGTYTM